MRNISDISIEFHLVTTVKKQSQDGNRIGTPFLIVSFFLSLPLLKQEKDCGCTEFHFEQHIVVVVAVAECDNVEYHGAWRRISSIDASGADADVGGE